MDTSESPSPVSRREEVLAIAALTFVLLVSAAWWAMALWPMPGGAPAWLETARAVCFGAAHDGLPSGGGWILLIGEPLGMLGAVWLLWRHSLASAFRRMARSSGGRATFAAAVLLLLAGVAAAGIRVQAAVAATSGMHLPSPGEGEIARLDRPAPPLRLIDQHGATLSLDRFRGRPILVTFAFGHCETVCPLLVTDALAAQRARPGDPPGVVVVSMDPWRDSPARLPSIAAAWGLGEDAFVVSGGVEAVGEVLEDWEVAWSRDPRTGDIAHAPLTYVLDRTGRVAYVTSGQAAHLVSLLETL